MARTSALLVGAYFAPFDSGTDHLGRSGAYELCSLLTIHWKRDNALYGATAAGYHLLAAHLAANGAWTSYGFYGACESGDVDMLNRFGSDQISASYAFVVACEHNHPNVVHYLFKYHDLNNENILGHACYHGHLGIIGILIAHGARDWNSGLFGACEGSHKHIARMMVDLGATECTFCGRAADDCETLKS